MILCLRCVNYIEEECKDDKCEWNDIIGKHRHFHCKHGKIKHYCKDYEVKLCKNTY